MVLRDCVHGRPRTGYRFQPDVLEFARKLGVAFRPRQAVAALREKYPAVSFGTYGGATTQCYLAIYRLVDDGLLRPIIIRQTDNRNYYAYQAVNIAEKKACNPQPDE